MVTSLATLIAIASVFALYCYATTWITSRGSVDSGESHRYLEWCEIELRLRGPEIRIEVARNGARRAIYPLAFRSGSGSSFLPDRVRDRRALLAYVAEECWGSGEAFSYHAIPVRSPRETLRIAVSGIFATNRRKHLAIG